MNTTLSREQKLAVFGELTKHPNIKRASVYADERSNLAKLKCDHPYSGLWKIDGPAEVPGFFHLSSSVPIGFDFYAERVDYQRFEIVLFETDFERL